MSTWAALWALSLNRIFYINIIIYYIRRSISDKKRKKNNKIKKKKKKKGLRERKYCGGKKDRVTDDYSAICPRPNQTTSDTPDNHHHHPQQPSVRTFLRERLCAYFNLSLFCLLFLYIHSSPLSITYICSDAMGMCTMPISAMRMGPAVEEENKREKPWQDEI